VRREFYTAAGLKCPLGSGVPSSISHRRPDQGRCNRHTTAVPSIGQRISVAFGGSESRQDFRNRGTVETLGEFRYDCNSLAVAKAENYRVGCSGSCQRSLGCEDLWRDPLPGNKGLTEHYASNRISSPLIVRVKVWPFGDAARARSAAVGIGSVQARSLICR